MILDRICNRIVPSIIHRRLRPSHLTLSLLIYQLLQVHPILMPIFHLLLHISQPLLLQSSLILFSLPDLKLFPSLFLLSPFLHLHLLYLHCLQCSGMLECLILAISVALFIENAWVDVFIDQLCQSVLLYGIIVNEPTLFLRLLNKL